MLAHLGVQYGNLGPFAAVGVKRSPASAASQTRGAVPVNGGKVSGLDQKRVVISRGQGEQATTDVNLM